MCGELIISQVTDRERISINGEPLSPEMFAKYFHEVWDRFQATDDVSARALTVNRTQLRSRLSSPAAI